METNDLDNLYFQVLIITSIWDKFTRKQNAPISYVLRNTRSAHDDTSNRWLSIDVDSDPRNTFDKFTPLYGEFSERNENLMGWDLMEPDLQVVEATN